MGFCQGGVLPDGVLSAGVLSGYCPVFQKRSFFNRKPNLVKIVVSDSCIIAHILLPDFIVMTRACAARHASLEILRNCRSKN